MKLKRFFKRQRAELFTTKESKGKKAMLLIDETRIISATKIFCYGFDIDTELQRKDFDGWYKRSDLTPHENKKKQGYVNGKLTTL
jgi:hypothetical protein